MSLSSLLLASGPKKLDKELDALFKTNPTPIQIPTPGSSAPPAKKKRKLDTVDAVAAISEDGVKKAKRSKAVNKEATTPKASPKLTPKPTKRPKKAKPAEREDADGDDEDNSDLENAYLEKQTSAPLRKAAEPDEEISDAEDEVGPVSEDDPDAPPPVHESLTKRVRSKPTKKAKIVPDGETTAQRDARTLFVGGLPVAIVQKKPLQKQLSRHLLSFLPSGSKVKMESTRFRSVAFRDPTSSNTLSSTSTPDASTKKVGANSVPITGANHASTRASTWRQASGNSKDKEDADADASAEKQYLTPAQKKKILFIQGAIHPEAQSVNAYVVLAHHTLPTVDVDEGEETEDMDTPYRAAAHIARTANASSFEERSLRVDLCARLPVSADQSDEQNADAGGAVGDPKRSVFVGNLDFGAREDDVREFFEGVLTAERGPAPPMGTASVGAAAEDETAVEEEDMGGLWVVGVRLVRDRETQLGKGFGYVRFVDRECVDEILALSKTEDGRKKLKFAKRTLRVQRCRAVGTSTKPAASATGGPKDGKATVRSTYPAALPKRGDPALGARIAHLDKDARKAAKKADSVRAERRAEKKMKTKARAKMGVGAANDKIKAAVTDGKRFGGRKVEKGAGKGKERARERKVRASKHGK